MEYMTSTAAKPLDEVDGVIPYELAARFGEKMPENLPVADQILFIGLRMLYGSCRLKIIDWDRLKRERNLLIHQCNYFRFRDDMSREVADSLRNTEAARCAYRKERTLENADRLLAAVEGR